MLQTVLRKKKPLLLGEIRRTHSEMDNSNHAVNKDLFKSSTYSSGTPFVVMPQITHIFGPGPGIVKSRIKGRSMSQKSKK